MVRTLSKVRHVPDMTCNLISLGTLEPNGCRYSAEHGVLKVTKGAMVLMKGLRQRSCNCSFSPEFLCPMWQHQLSYTSNNSTVIFIEDFQIYFTSMKTIKKIYNNL